MVGFPGQQRPFHFNDIANANSPGRALGGCVVEIWEAVWGGWAHSGPFMDTWTLGSGEGRGVLAVILMTIK